MTLQTIFLAVLLVIGALLSAACAVVLGRALPKRSPYVLAVLASVIPFVLLVAVPFFMVMVFGAGSFEYAIVLYVHMTPRAAAIFASGLGVDLIAAFLTVRLVHSRSGRAQTPDPHVFE